jgi:uncharacterized protein involved in cysteine biosynthesis
MAFISDIMAPGGGILLLPFVRIVISILLVCTLTTFVVGVARIHMAILSFLSAGLLFSLHMFETAYNNIKSKSDNIKVVSNSSNNTRSEKTD